jgi:AcrR family transcriptional regulator
VSAPVTGTGPPESTDLRQRRRAFTADEIERVAIEQFAARGFGDVTVDDIADAAGISPRTFFRYFPTKAHVVRAHQHRLLDRLVRALAARPANEGPVTALREAFLATARMRAEDRDRIVLVGRLLSSTGDALARDVGFEVDETDELVGLVARRAGLDPDLDMRPAVIVAAMVGAAQAAFRAWLEGGGAVELATLVADALALVTGGLGELDHVGGRPTATRRPRAK